MNELFSQAQAVIPGGVNSPVRAFKAVGGEPFFVDRAEGAYLYDTNDKRYIDYVLSWGPMILGHADQDVLAAVVEKAKKGLSFGAPRLLRQSWLKPLLILSLVLRKYAWSAPAPKPP